MNPVPETKFASDVHRRPGAHRSIDGAKGRVCSPPDPEGPHHTPDFAAYRTAGHLFRLVRAMGRPGLVRSMARTAVFNVAATVASGLGGVVIARAVGPTVRGEYAGVTAWYSVTVLIGGMGQPAALCFFVARDPARSCDYVTTSRAMMLATGALALLTGMIIAPLLAHGNPGIASAYRIAFGVSIIALVASSYTYSLQARDISRWNVCRTIQPAVSLIAILALWRLQMLTLDVAVVILGLTISIQLGWAYVSCRRTGLVPGHARVELMRPLAAYGIAQIAGFTPAAINQQLDQLVLSQTVPAADLGRYAIATSLTLLPLSVVSAIGFVAFPRLASRRVVTAETRRLQRLSLLGSAGLTVVTLLPLALLAPWFVPLIFGASYLGAVPLIWLLTPGAAFMICGQVVVDLLLGRGHPSVVAWAQTLAAVSTVALLFALLPFIGVYAAAIASTVSYGVAFAVMLRRLLHLPAHARGSGPRGPGDPTPLVA
jgi:O-antigen/teichoic acid export membrane protein